MTNKHQDYTGGIGRDAIYLSSSTSLDLRLQSVHHAFGLLQTPKVRVFRDRRKKRLLLLHIQLIRREHESFNDVTPAQDQLSPY